MTDTLDSVAAACIALYKACEQAGAEAPDIVFGDQMSGIKFEAELKFSKSYRDHAIARRVETSAHNEIIVAGIKINWPSK